MRRGLIAAAIALGLVGLYALAGFVGVPYGLRYGLTRFAKEQLHRPLTLGEIHFNPFTWRLEMRDLSLPDADGAPLLGLHRLIVRIELASLWRGPSFAHILLERPAARVVLRQNGSLNLADLGKGFAKTPPPAKPQAPLRFSIDRLTVIDGRAAYEEATRHVPFRAELRPINFELRDFRSLGRAADAYALDFTTALGERFTWRGRLGLNPVTSRGAFTIQDLRARTLWSYLREVLPVEVSSGQLALEGNYELTGLSPFGLSIMVGSARLSDFAVRPKGAPEDYVRLEKLEARDTRVDLARREIAVGTVRLEGGSAHAWLNPDGTTNFTALMAARAASTHDTAPVTPAAGPPVADRAPSPPPADQGAPPGPNGGAASPGMASWKIAAPDIAVSGFRVVAEDRAIEPTVTATLDPIRVSVKGLQLPAQAPLEVEARTGINGTGDLQARGTYALGSGETHAHLQLAKFDVTPLQPFVAQHAALNLRSGQLAGAIEVERSADGAISVSGDTQLAKLRMTDALLQQDFLKWERLNLSGVRLRTQPMSLQIRDIEVRAPYARVILANDRSVNLSEALAPEKPGAGTKPVAEAAPSAGANANAQPASVSAESGRGIVLGAARAKSPSGPSSRTSPIFFQTAINRIRITNGTVRYTDLWIQPNFTVTIQELAGTIEGLSSDSKSNARVDLTGSVDRYAPVHIWGTTNPLSATLATDLKMSFRGLELTTVTPYSARFAGYKIEKGKLSVDIAYHIDNRKLQADHHVVIDQLQLGDRVESKDSVKLPLKLAIALLRDRNGVIDLGLPVTGSLDDPKFSVWPIVWKALFGLLEKAVTAPFAMIGKLFGGGDQVNQIEFAAGSAELDAANRDRLTAVQKALRERPQLRLDVPSPYASDLDGPALKAHTVQTQLLAVKRRELVQGAQFDDSAGAAALKDPNEHFRLLVAAYTTPANAADPNGKPNKAAKPDQAELPAQTAAILKAQKKKGGPAPDLQPGIDELQSALLERAMVSDEDLQALGRQRAKAVQDALLSGGDVDPTRVFIVAAAAHPAEHDKVRLELALK